MSAFLFALLILLNIPQLVYGQDAPLVELEPIIISPRQGSISSSYQLEEISDSALEALANLALDLQSRNLSKGIQSDFSLRGSTFQGVLILIDGQRINDPQTAHHNCDIPLTAHDIRSIEIIPPGGSSSFGPDAIGGAINIKTRDPQNKKTLRLSSGEHNLRSGSFSFGLAREGFGLRYSLEREEAGGFTYDREFKKFTSSLQYNINLPQGIFKTTWGYQEKEFGAYDFYTPAKGYPSQEWTKTYLLNSGLELDQGGMMIKPNFLWRRHFDKFMLDKTQQRTNYLNHHRSDVYTPSIYFQRQTHQLGKIGLGLEYGKEQIDSTNLGQRHREHKGIFFDQARDLGEDLWIGGSVRFDDFQGLDEVFSAAFNLRYRFRPRDFLYLGLSRNIRLPSFTELYYNDPTTLGNPDLSTEESFNYEIGLGCNRANFSFGLTGFLRIEQDFIDWVKYSSGQEKWQAENITEAEVCGMEGNLRIGINKDIVLTSNYSYINKRINDKGCLYKYGPNYVRHLFNSVFEFNLPFGIQKIRFHYKKRPRRDGWFIVDAHLSYNLNKVSKIFLKVNNLFNVEFQEIEGIAQPGRWAELGVKFEW